MKKTYIVFLLLLCLLLGGCRRGDVSAVETTQDPSQIYTEAEITAAMDVVQNFFQKEFGGCTLKKLWYDEEFSLREADGWTKQYEAKECIVLLSEFSVDESGGDGSLNPNDTYDNWSWVLVRNNESDRWQLKTWGY